MRLAAATFWLGYDVVSVPLKFTDDFGADGDGAPMPG